MAQSYFRSPDGENAVKGKYNDWLRHWPVAKEKLVLDTRHGTTHVVVSGKAESPPLLLLHGAATSSIVWLHDVEAYAKSHRVYAVDIIGEANHSAAQRPPLKGDAYVEWMEDLLAALNIERVAMAGVCFGAWCCLKFASTHPDRVTRLALLCPSGIVGLRKRYRMKAGLLAGLLGPWGLRLLRRRILARDHMAPWLAEFHQLTTRHFKRRGSPPAVAGKQLAQIYCPVLLVVGGRDAYYDSDKIILRLSKALPQVQIHFRPRDGHMQWNFVHELDRFLLTQYGPE